MIKTKSVLLFILICLLLGSCSASTPSELSFFSFDTYIDFKSYEGGSPTTLEELKTETMRLEKVFNRHDPESHLSSLKKESQGNEEFQELLSLAKEVEKETSGAFNPYLARVSRLWSFGSDKERIPSQEEIDKAREDAKTRSIEDLDLGGIAKGYAADVLQKKAKALGIKSGVFNLGGNIITIGEYQGRDYAIGIQDPLAKTGEVVGVLRFKENSAVTSGGYQRFFEQGGKRYHHLLDPKTGYPAENDLLSVTVVLPESARADAYSTALFVMGYEKAKDFAEEKKLPVVLIRKDKKITVLDFGAFSFDLKGEDYSLDPK